MPIWTIIHYTNLCGDLFGIFKSNNSFY